MIELPSLYPHQLTMLNDLRSAIAARKRVILCAPPGTGKTRLAKWILGSFANRGKQSNCSGNAIFAVHRRGLVDNASGSFQEDPRLPHGIIMAGNRMDYGKRVQVASIDTMNSWYCEGGRYDTSRTFDLVIFDECHSHLSKLRTFLDSHDRTRADMGLEPAYVLGLSATPQHKELGQVFRQIVKGPSPQWLIDNNYLSPFRYFRCTQGRLDRLVRRGDDYTKNSVFEAMQGLSGDLVRDWKKHAQGRATIGFFPRRSHAQEAMSLLRQNGVDAHYLDGNTPDEERRDLYRRLNNGEIDYLCNVGVIERGTDIPRAACIQMCTAVGNVVRWKQMIGRGSRRHPDKTDCMILDHANGITNHGFFEDDTAWTLDWGERPSKTHEPRVSIECPSCGAVYRGGKCKACGYEPTGRQRAAQGLEFDGGELKELKRTARKEKSKKTCEQLLISALFITGRRGQTFGQAWFVAKSMAEQQGTRFRVPYEFSVGVWRYRSIPYGNPDSKKRVRDTYGFTVGLMGDGDNPYRIGRVARSTHQPKFLQVEMVQDALFS